MALALFVGTFLFMIFVGLPLYVVFSFIRAALTGKLPDGTTLSDTSPTNTDN